SRRRRGPLSRHPAQLADARRPLPALQGSPHVGESRPMTLDADVIVDRRRTRRKLAFWRVLAFLLLAAMLVTLLVVAAGGFGERTRPHVARVSVSGVIVEDRRLVELFERLAESDAVSGVVI